MLGQKMKHLKKLANKVKAVNGVLDSEPSHCKRLLRELDHEEEGQRDSPKSKTPNGFFAVYVGVERRRFVVPTSFLSHPLFKMLLEKASDEFGYDQRNGLAVPCSVSTFQEILNAVECSPAKFDFGKLVEEFL